MKKKQGFRPYLKRGEVIKFVKTRNVKTPEYGTYGSVGIDFFVPEDFEQTEIPPGDDIIIPSGIKVRLPKYTALIAGNKSGVATKSKLDKGAEIIDWDYQGEIHIHVHNFTSDQTTTIEPGDKIIQFLLTPIIQAKMFDVETEDNLYKNSSSERGESGFGSTNQ